MAKPKQPNWKPAKAQGQIACSSKTVEEGPVQTRPNAPPSSSEDGLFPVHVQQLDDRGRTDTRPTSKPSIQIPRRASSTDKKEVREQPPDHGSSRDAQSDSQARVWQQHPKVCVGRPSSAL